MSAFDIFPDDSNENPNPYGYVPSPEWQAAIEQAAPGMLGVMQQQTATPTQSWVDTLSRAMSVVGMTYAQNRLLSVQLERARQGLPPLDASAYTPGVAVNVGIDPKLRNAVLLGGGVLLVAFLLKKG